MSTTSKSLYLGNGKEIIDSFILLQLHVNPSKESQWQVDAVFPFFLSPLPPLPQALVA